MSCERGVGLRMVRIVRISGVVRTSGILRTSGIVRISGVVRIFRTERESDVNSRRHAVASGMLSDELSACFDRSQSELLLLIHGPHGSMPL